MLQEKLNELAPYFKKIEIGANSPTFILVEFPNTWMIPKNVLKDTVKCTANNNIKPSKEGTKCYVFHSGSHETTKEEGIMVIDPIEELITAIKETITYNEELVERRTLYEEKVKELKDLFDNEPSLNRLSTLAFCFGDEDDDISSTMGQLQIPKEEDGDTPITPTSRKKSR